MRPKITFRDLRQKRVFWGEKSPVVTGLDNELSQSLDMWRAKYRRFEDRVFSPLSMDVRASLLALSKIQDEAADKACSLLDSKTYVLIKYAAYLDFRRENPKPAIIPPDVLLIRKVVVGVVVLAISPQRLRELAALALSELPKNAGGRPRKNSLDHLFACALVHHWLRILGTKPTAQDGGTPFMDWASEMFKNVNAPRKDHTKVLKRAIKEVTKKG